MRTAHRSILALPITHYPSPLLGGSKIALEDALGGDGIQTGLEPGTARACRSQQALGLDGGEALVHEFGVQAETAVQALRETAGEFPDRVLRAVGMRGLTDQQQGGPPFGDQLPDCREACPILHLEKGRQGMRQPGFEITDRDADAPGAEVEGEDGARPRVRDEG